TDRPPVSAVEWGRLELTEIRLVEAAHIDGDHLVAFRIRSTREGAHAAVRTEQVMDGFLAELVVLEAVRARTQREVCGRHERPECAALLADRADASNDVNEVGCHLETHLSAMAAAGVGLGSGHFSSPSRPESRSACPAPLGRRAGPRIVGSNSSTCRRT